MKLSPAQKLEMKRQLKALLLKEGLSQKQAADILGISVKTVCIWVKEDGYRDELKSCKGKCVTQTHDSLSEFQARVRVRHPQHYPLVHQLIEDYRKPYLKGI